MTKRCTKQIIDIKTKKKRQCKNKSLLNYKRCYQHSSSKLAKLSSRQRGGNQYALSDLKKGDILLFNYGGPKLKGEWRHAEIMIDGNEDRIFTGACFSNVCDVMRRGKMDQNKKLDQDYTIRVIRFKNNGVAEIASQMACKILESKQKYTNLAKLCFKATQSCFVVPEAAKAWTKEKIDNIISGKEHSSLYCSELIALVWLSTLSLQYPEEVKYMFPIGHVGGCKPFNLDELITNSKFNEYWKHIGDFKNIISTGATSGKRFFACGR